MDALWQAGVRPSERDEALAVDQATQAHLQDMRACTFALLEAKGVKAVKP